LGGRSLDGRIESLDLRAVAVASEGST
jgi:hypothetical protein